MFSEEELCIIGLKLCDLMEELNSACLFVFPPKGIMLTVCICICVQDWPFAI